MEDGEDNETLGKSFLSQCDSCKNLKSFRTNDDWDRKTISKIDSIEELLIKLENSSNMKFLNVELTDTKTLEELINRLKSFSKKESKSKIYFWKVLPFFIVALIAFHHFFQDNFIPDLRFLRIFKLINIK